jgi:hypothetical protein
LTVTKPFSFVSYLATTARCLCQFVGVFDLDDAALDERDIVNVGKSDLVQFLDNPRLRGARALGNERRDGSRDVASAQDLVSVNVRVLATVSTGTAQRRRRVQIDYLFFNEPALAAIFFRAGV